MATDETALAVRRRTGSPLWMALQTFIFSVVLLAGAAVGRGQGLDAAFDANVAPNVQFTSYVYAATVQPDGKILIGGAFTSVLGVARNNIARLNADGTLDATFNPNADGEVLCIAVQPDGKILAGGFFNNIGGQSRPFIARLDATTGAADTAFNANAIGTNVFSIAVQTDGNIVVGGVFTNMGGQARINLARLGTTGAADSFNPSPSSTVRALAIQRDGKILVGGLFTTIAGQTRNRIARFDSNGTLDSFDPNVSNSVVRTFAIQADGKILVGGQFTGTIGGQPRLRIARLDPTTGAPDSFNPTASGIVFSIVVQADGKILLGGQFLTLSPNGGAAVTRNRIARVNSDGTLDAGFDPNADEQVYGIALLTDGKLMVGGTFQNIGGGARSFLARLNNNTAATQSLAATQSTVTWTRGGSSVQFNRVTFESSPDNVTFSALGAGTPSGSDWTLTGLSLPAGQTITIRARGYFRTGYQGGSESSLQLVQNFTFASPPTVFSAQTPPASGTAGIAYAGYTFAANGAPAPTYTVQSGTLPGGLALSSAGVLSGIPTAAGAFSGIVVRATNVGGTLDTAPFTITIAPKVTVDTASIPATNTSLVINGFGFSGIPANNIVSFSGGVTGTIAASTATTLTISSLSGLTGGALNASVTTNSVSSGAAVQVATVAPVVTSSTANLAANATTITINGFGFSATLANNTVVFNDSATGNVTAASATSITVTFGTKPANAGSLTASVTTNGANSGAAVQVATVIPVVTPSAANLAGNATTITINGFGFSATPANNTVAFSGGATGTVTASSATQLTVTSLTGLVGGSLTAVVTSNGISSGAAVQVGTVTVPPTITSGSSTTFTAGTVGSFTVTTTGVPSSALSKTGALPGGVTFIDNGNGTAALGGTPGALTGGTYPITITANNGVAPNATQSFTLKVQGPPTVSNVAVNANEDIALAFSAGNFTASYSDPNSDPLVTVRITSLPTNGVLKNGATTISTVPTDIALGSIANLTYTSNLNYNGPDSFGWNGSDGTLFATSAATVNVTVAAVNDKPNFTAANPPAVNEDAGAQSVVGWVTAFAPGPNEAGQTVLAYTVSTVGTPALFSTPPAVANNGTLTYTPAANANGTSTFSVRVQDSGGVALGGVDTSDPQSFTITVNAVNDNPVAGGDSIERYPTQSTKVRVSVLLANDTDPDGDTPLSITAVGAAASGQATVTLSGGYVFYQPNAGFLTGDTFTYTLSDGHGGTALGTVTVTIHADNAPAQNITKLEMLPNGSAHIVFAGIPGRAYRVQSTDSLAPPNWVDQAVFLANAQGKIDFTDPPPLPPTRFYRTLSP